MPSKTVAVLGASYGGARVANLLAQDLPVGWRVVLIDRNSHMNHLYVLPRYAVLPGHEHKAFIPYTNVFLPQPSPDAPSTSTAPPPPSNGPHVCLHASVTSVASYSLTLDKPFPQHGISASDRTLHFDYLVYALGSHLPSPINIWGPVADEDVENSNVLDVTRGTKLGGVAWLKRFQKCVERTSSVLVVGGGALGIQFATDIAEIYPNARVTLLHSRNRLLPRFDEAMHSEVLSSLSMLDVCTILGDRLDLSSVSEKQTRGGERIVRTQSGRELSAELILLCTGQTPNTGLMRDAFPQSVIPNGPDRGLVRVRRTMQIAERVSPVDEFPVEFSELSPSEPSTPPLSPSDSSSSSSSSDGEHDDNEEEDMPLEDIEEDPTTRVLAEHIFVIGDAADAFGAINAGYNAFFQGNVAAANILKLIERAERGSRDECNRVDGDEPDEEDLTLGKYAPGLPAIKVTLGLTRCVYQYDGMIGTRDHEPADLDAHLIWRFFGYPDVKREDLEHDVDDGEEPVVEAPGKSETELADVREPAEPMQAQAVTLAA